MIYVELGDDVEYVVEGEGTILFQLESRGSLEAQDVLYVLELKMNLVSVSALEDKGFVVLFQNGQVPIHSEGANPDTAVSIGVRKGKVNTLQGEPVSGSKGILDHGSMSVAEDKEQEALKGEELSHLTRGHGTRRTRKYEYPTRARQPPEVGHVGHVIYIYIY
jgi:hypothetical protein